MNIFMLLLFIIIVVLFVSVIGFFGIMIKELCEQIFSDSDWAERFLFIMFICGMCILVWAMCLLTWLVYGVCF